MDKAGAEWLKRQTPNYVSSWQACGDNEVESQIMASHTQQNRTLSFFELQEEPFAATADPAYFYATREHRECLFRLWTSVDERHGIAVVLGNYGTGKTTLLRKLLTEMQDRPREYNTAVIGSPIPSWTSFALLEKIIDQFGIKRPDSRAFMDYMEALYRYLAQHHDKVNTLIIDDAQNLNKRGQLELLRLAQNLETSQHKLLNLICFSQLEWADILRAAPNFLQRVNLTYTLPAIGYDETRELIQFRLRQAGSGDKGPVFEDGAIRAIHGYAQGSPRLIVTLCRNALMLAAQVHARQVGQAIILQTIQKTTLPDAGKQSRVAEELSRPAPEKPAPPPRFAVPAQDSNVDEKTQDPGLKENESRANQMLRRAARANLNRGGGQGQSQ